MDMSLFIPMCGNRLIKSPPLWGFGAGAKIITAIFRARPKGAVVNNGTVSLFLLVRVIR